MSTGHAYRQILRASSIIGGASVVNVLLGLLRNKAAAVLLGPAGVGLIGLLQSLVATASTVAALGFGNVGTRQIAEAAGTGDDVAIAAARRALAIGTFVLALVGAGVFWALRDLLAVRVLGDARLADEVGWLALAVALTVAAGSQVALLTGLRRIGDIARVSVSSAALSTLLGVGALWLWRGDALTAFVLAAPVASFLLGHFYVARLPRTHAVRAPFPQLVAQWRTLARLGLAFVGTGLVGHLGLLLVRTLVQRELGTHALGQFQASWTVSMTYIGFVLTAMGTDFYPRLTAAMRDRAEAMRIVNDQSEVALLLAGPVLLGALSLSPWLFELLFSSRFQEAATVFRWQVLGDVIRVSAWPLGLAVLAAGDARSYVLSESLATVAFVGLTWLGLPVLGVKAAGVAFLGMYLVYLPLVYGFVRYRIDLRWRGAVMRYLASLAVATAAVSAVAEWDVRVGALLGVPLAALFAVHGARRLRSGAGFGTPLGHAGQLVHESAEEPCALEAKNESGSYTRDV